MTGDFMEAKQIIEGGTAILGIEFGSTRIKSVLTDASHNILATGIYDWENSLVDGIWTYPMDEIMKGMRGSYASLAADVKEKYQTSIKKLSAIGISAMMHGYLPFDKDGKQLAEFRTWRNTMTAEAAGVLSKEFNFNIPQRWSIAHLYQAILSGESHVKDISFLTTLAGYIHFRLTGEKNMGVGEASGMFPIDPATCDYDEKMIASFDALIADKGFSWKIKDILPKVLKAGEKAGCLTADGAALLDESGELQAGAVFAPCEGDAGTGMCATNAVKPGTGNISAGTSVFSMVVLDKNLGKPHEEIDVVTTPEGLPVAMVHCNNCSSDINAWVKLFADFAKVMGLEVNVGDIYTKLFTDAYKNGAADCGGVLSINYFSGEPVTGLVNGRPMVVRTPDADFTMANFMRSNIYSAFATLKYGNDILSREENVKTEVMMAQGGLFKTPLAAQQMLADALDCPVTVPDTASEGGAWGMAVLAAFVLNKESGESLGDYLEKKVFSGQGQKTLSPDPEGVKGFDKYLEGYKKALKAEKIVADS